MARLVPLLGRAFRYGLAGLLNSALGFAVIAALDLGLRVRPELANAVGYAVGIAASFVLAKAFVFRSRDRARSTGPRYILVILAAFALNQLTLKLALSVLAAGPLQHILAQAAGMAVYTGFGFVGCQVWVFPAREAAGQDLAEVD